MNDEKELHHPFKNGSWAGFPKIRPKPMPTRFNLKGTDWKLEAGDWKLER